jgi:hypothetical protein
VWGFGVLADRRVADLFAGVWIFPHGAIGGWIVDLDGPGNGGVSGSVGDSIGNLMVGLRVHFLTPFGSVFTITLP